MKGDTPLIHRIPVKTRDGRTVGEREVVSYRGLLDLVHRERLRSIRTELLQAPSSMNGQTAIVRATIRTGRGTFSGIGDANPGNVTPHIVPHLIRMAETRAEARAMRKAVNIGVVSREELGEEFDPADPPSPTQPANDNATSPPRGDAWEEPRDERAAAPVATERRETRGISSRATDQQRRFLYRLLAERGLEGDAARAYIHRELGVASLDEAPKNAVSGLIDQIKHANGSFNANERDRATGSR